MISVSLSHLASPKIVNRSRNIEINDISTVKIMNLPLMYVFYKPKSLPHFGKLIHSNEVVVLLGRREPSRSCGWIIYTIQAINTGFKQAALHYVISIPHSLSDHGFLD
jgi:hypothetical protein